MHVLSSNPPNVIFVLFGEMCIFVHLVVQILDSKSGDFLVAPDISLCVVQCRVCCGIELLPLIVFIVLYF